MTAGIGVVGLSGEDMIPNLLESGINIRRGDASLRSCSCFGEYLIGLMREMRHNRANRDSHLLHLKHLRAANAGCHLVGGDRASSCASEAHFVEVAPVCDAACAIWDCSALLRPWIALGLLRCTRSRRTWWARRWLRWTTGRLGRGLGRGFGRGLAWCFAWCFGRSLCRSLCFGAFHEHGMTISNVSEKKL